MILSIFVLLLFIFYEAGGFKLLMDFYRFPEPEPEPLQQVPEPIPPAPRPEPVKVTPAPVQIVKPAPVQTIPEPEPVKPEPMPEPEPANPAGGTMPNLETMNREQLEKVACDCLTLAGFKFNTYYYCRNKSDIELMDIIIDFFR